MKVKFKSKEAYNQFKNSSFEINKIFCKYVDENTVFQVPSLNDSINVFEVLLENGKQLWDVNRHFFNCKYGVLFRWSDEIDLLEEVSEVSEDTEIQTENSFIIKFNIQFKGSYSKEVLLEIADKLKAMAEL